MHLTGDGVPVNLDLAERLLTAAHELREAPIATYLGLAYVRVLRAWKATFVGPVRAVWEFIGGGQPGNRDTHQAVTNVDEDSSELK
jgi:hypothetical protein